MVLVVYTLLDDGVAWVRARLGGRKAAGPPFGGGRGRMPEREESPVAAD